MGAGLPNGFGDRNLVFGQSASDRMRPCALSFLISFHFMLAGCRGLPQPVALPDLHVMRIGQLEFRSNFELPRDHRLVRELTAERDDISTTLGLPAGNEIITVYLFRDAETYGQYLSRHFPGVPSRRAFFLESDTRLTVYAHWSDRVAEDLRHEIAHGYLHSIVPGIPLWLDEGLAEYFEVPRGQNGFHRPHLDLLSDMMAHNGWKPDLARLEGLSDAAQMEQSDYAESWAWVYALLNSDPVQRDVLTGYLADVHASGRVEALSRRLRTQSAGAEQALAKYLAELQRNQTVR
jgi:hypothetical protein